MADVAHIRRRTSRDGQTSFTVIWRADGKQESELFASEDAARRFRDLVSAHGQRWPAGWIKGVGFVDPAEECAEEERFGPFAHRYIDLLTGISGQTRSNYHKFVDSHMLPWFQNLAVRECGSGIGREHIRQWINDLEAGTPGPHHDETVTRKPLAAKTIANQHGLLFSILQAAVDAEPPLRSSNPCTHTRLPKGDQTEDDEVFLEREEYRLLRSHLATDAVDLIDAAVGTGLRWGELTALQPRDFTLTSARPRLRIQRSWKRHENGGKYLGSPKTKKSRRTLILTPGQVALFKRNCRGKNPHDLLFTAPEGGPWDSGGFWAARWKHALRGAAEEGLTKWPRIHDLRHTHASWMIAAKVPLPAVQARLGHESITTTIDRYGHLLAAMDDEIITAVEWGMLENNHTAPESDLATH